MVTQARGVPDGIAGMVATVALVGELDAAVGELLAALSRAAHRFDGDAAAALLWEIRCALDAGERARDQARPIVRRLAWG